MRSTSSRKTEECSIETQAKRTSKKSAKASERRLREFIAYSLLILYSLGYLATILLLVLNGLAITCLSEKVLLSLLGATFLKHVGLMVILLQHLFPVRHASQ